MASKPIYYWDSCIFYEWLGNEAVAQSKKDAIDELIEANSKKQNIIYTSIVTHLEVLPTKINNKHLSAEQTYLSLFDGVKFVEQEINRNILMRAREIREYYYKAPDAQANFKGKMMDAGDAIHLATATIFGCTEFHTRDCDTKGMKVPLLKLYDYNKTGKTGVCEKYPLDIASPDNQQQSFGFQQNVQNSPTG